LARNISRIRIKGMYAECWWGNFLENYNLENREEDGKIILRWI